MADPAHDTARPRIALVGPVFPYRAGIAYCTTALASELAKHADIDVISFSRQYPKLFYPGGTDIDETLRSRTPAAARLELDILNPLTWIRTGLRLRRNPPDAVVFVWWVWVWALPYLTIIRLLRRSTRVIMQGHNVSDKEPAGWKSRLTNAVLRRASAVIVHARSDEEEVVKRLGMGPDSGAGSETRSSARPRRPKRPPLHSHGDVPQIVSTFLPVHELGGPVPARAEARRRLGLPDGPLALFFGHVRPFKGLDIALRAWGLLTTPVTLLVAGEAWWKSAEEYRRLSRELGLAFEEFSPPADREPAGPAAAAAMAPRVMFDFRFIPDSEIADYFAACNVVVAPYRSEAQSGVAMTAFHFGRPVIAAAVGGLPEIIDGSNGVLVPPEDPPALAAAIEAFFGRSDRGALERGAAVAAARYSWAEYAARLLRLVDSRG